MKWKAYRSGVKWAVVLFVLAGLLWLWGFWTGAEGEAVTGGVTESSRRVLDARWRSLPEKEMTIGEMERYAAGLSDEELAEQVESLTYAWLEKVKGLSRPAPPRMVIILAREEGKRHGKDGWQKIEDLCWEINEKLSGEDIDPRFEDYCELHPQLELAAFGGYVAQKPEEAVKEFLDQWATVSKVGLGGWRGYDETFEDVIYGKLIGGGIGRLAGEDSERAFKHVERSQEVLPWNCRELVSDFLLGIPPQDRDSWLERVSKQWPQESAFFQITLSSPDGVKEILIQNRDLYPWALPEYFRNLTGEQLVEIASDLRIDLRHRRHIAEHLFSYSKLPISDVLAFPKEVQIEVLENELGRIIGWNEWDYCGPIEGKEIPWEQDRRERIGPVEEVLSKSELDPKEKADLMERLVEERKEMGIDD